MHNVLIMGSGKIGSLIACLLAGSGSYNVHLADKVITTNPLQAHSDQFSNLTFATLDAESSSDITAYLKKHGITVLVSSLPYFKNAQMMKLAVDKGLHYFDLTEDTQVASLAKKLGHNCKTVVASQCGLAPGFISIVTHCMAQQFDAIDAIKMRVGALPKNISNALQYSLAWSVEGLINQYGNLCSALINGKHVHVLPLEGLEEIKLDGLTYEAFYTSGGIGTLLDTYKGRVQHMDYKAVRYPGHCAKMRLLMNDLRLNEDRPLLCRILNNALPKTGQDVVLVYVSVVGKKEGNLEEKNYLKKFYPVTISELDWSAIQITAAAGLCATVDITLTNLDKYKGQVRQEDIGLSELLDNRFGKYYA